MVYVSADTDYSAVPCKQNGSEVQRYRLLKTIIAEVTDQLDAVGRKIV